MGMVRKVVKSKERKGGGDRYGASGVRQKGYLEEGEVEGWVARARQVTAEALSKRSVRNDN